MFQRSRILRLFLNASVTMAVVFFVLIGATHCEPETWGTHVFLPAGTKGVSWCARACVTANGFLCTSGHTSKPNLIHRPAGINIYCRRM
jgi:hypothetical protein